MKLAENYTYLKNYRPSAWLIPAVDLVFELDPAATVVTAKLQIEANPAVSAGDLVLDGEGLELIAISINGVALTADAYHASDAHLTIFQPLPPKFTLESQVKISPSENTKLEGLYLSSDNFCTQCEAEGFRAISYFIDRPDILSVYTVTIIAEQAQYPVLLSNGNLLKTEDRAEGKHMALWHDPFAKPCYLFALVAGDLVPLHDTFTTVSGRQIELYIFVEAHNRHLCDFALTSLQQAMRWDEEVYGLEYDLDRYNIVAVDDFNMGAMENKSLNIFNSKYVLADKASATDDDFLNIQSVIAHEYFHNYSGNRVTCRDWFQLSLKEGLTVFRDQQFSADMNSAVVKRIEDVAFLRKYQFAEDESALAHPVRPDEYIEINNFYTVTVYEKGAEIIRMLHTMLGASHWRQVMDEYFARFDGQAVTVEDLLSCASQVADKDYNMMMQWYKQAGTPLIKADWQFVDEIRGMRLTLEQQTDVLSIPFKLAWIDNEQVTNTETIILSARKETFDYPGLSAKAVPSLLQGFSAPIKLTAAYGGDDLLKIIKYDTDGFNRWDALQLLSLDLLFGKTKDNSLVLSSFTDVLQNCLHDPAYSAQMLKLPDLSTLCATADVLHIDQLIARYHAVKHSLAGALEPIILKLYNQLWQTHADIVDREHMGRRSLQNRLLLLLADNRHELVEDLAYAQYVGAVTMTDKIAAITALLNMQADKSSEVLSDFYQTWQQSPLVIDKWFALQAQVERADVFATVDRLTAHPDFNHLNPNRARSLLSVFAANPAGLHRKDSLAYDFIATWVKKLDQTNPQIAARLCKSLAIYPKLDLERQRMIVGNLKKLAAGKLSKDVFEVVTNLLGKLPR